MSVAPQVFEQKADAVRIAMERHSQRLLTAFIASGTFFMLLPVNLSGRLEPDWDQRSLFLHSES
jgi:hypothetical protein